MALQMDPGEILREYNASANKDKQITILADLNACRPMEIALCLREQGAALGGTWRARLSAHDRKKTREAPPTPELENAGGHEDAFERFQPLTAGQLQELLAAVPEDTPVQIVGHAGFASSAMYLVRADSKGCSCVLRILREEAPA